MKISERLLYLLEMALSPSEFVTKLRTDSLEPAFREYMKQYLVDTYNLQSYVDGHSWENEEKRLIKLSTKIYNKKITFSTKSKNTKFKEAIEDTTPEAIAKKAKDVIIDIIISNRAPQQTRMQVEKFDTTSELVPTLFKSFLKNNLPSNLGKLV